MLSSSTMEIKDTLDTVESPPLTDESVQTLPVDTLLHILAFAGFGDISFDMNALVEIDDDEYNEDDDDGNFSWKKSSKKRNRKQSKKKRAAKRKRSSKKNLGRSQEEVYVEQGLIRTLYGKFKQDSRGQYHLLYRDCSFRGELDCDGVRAKINALVLKKLMRVSGLLSLDIAIMGDKEYLAFCEELQNPHLLSSTVKTLELYLNEESLRCTSDLMIDVAQGLASWTNVNRLILDEVQRLSFAFFDALFTRPWHSLQMHDVSLFRSNNIIKCICVCFEKHPDSGKQLHTLIIDRARRYRNYYISTTRTEEEEKEEFDSLSPAGLLECCPNLRVLTLKWLSSQENYSLAVRGIQSNPRLIRNFESGYTLDV